MAGRSCLEFGPKAFVIRRLLKSSRPRRKPLAGATTPYASRESETSTTNSVPATSVSAHLKRVLSRPPTDWEEAVNSHRCRLGIVFVLAIACVILAGSAAFRVYESRTVKQTLDRARNQMAAGHYASARKLLMEPRLEHAADGEVDYLLGVCEWRRGQPNAAIEAWEHVPQTSPFGSRTAAELANLLMDAGRLTRAEEILEAARAQNRTRRTADPATASHALRNRGTHR